ncbi:MAG: DUF4388 domain-containing protein, partial [Myxococcales bacterium]|nr:DUF4388 domain-containing protein [Myxococcales bacterium]
MVASGSLLDRPFGRVLATIAQRRFSGELTVSAGGQRGSIVFQDGYVVAATGSHPADSAVKVALGAGLANPTQANAMLRALQDGRDEFEVVAEVARLSPDHVLRLRRRVVANRAMRLFGLTEGDLVVDDVATTAAAPDMVPIDPRVILYQGALAHLDEPRINAELATLGDAFRLRDGVRDGLDAFGFGDAEQPVLDALAAHAVTPPALAQAAPEVEARVSAAVLYALAMWGYAEPAATEARPSAAIAAAVMTG